MKLLRYISFCILLLFGGAGYSQNSLLKSVPLVRYNLILDGVDEYLNTDNLLSVLSTTIKGTWLCWIKPVTAMPAGSEMIITFGDTNANNFIQLFIQSTGVLQAAARTTSAVQWIIDTDNAVFSDNTWTLVGFVQPADGNGVIMYIDGIAPPQTFIINVTPDFWFNDLSVSIDNGRIGSLDKNSSGNTNHIRSDIDQVSYWNIDLSQLEILEVFNNNKPTNLKGHSKVSNLVAWYQMGEFSSFDGTNWNIIDASLNNNIAISVNMEESDRIVSTLIYEQPVGMLKVGNNLITSP